MKSMFEPAKKPSGEDQELKKVLAQSMQDLGIAQEQQYSPGIQACLNTGFSVE